jgi:Zn-dependent protease
MYFISVNIGLAVFNLIPIPPLDGSKVLIQFLPTRTVIWIQRNQMIISIVFMILVVSGLLSVPIGFISGKIYDFFFWSTGWVDIIMNAITG